MAQRRISSRLSTETRYPGSEPGSPAAARIEIPALTILAHPDFGRIGELAILPQLGSGEAVALSRLEPLFAAPGMAETRPLADPHLSRQPLRFVPGRTAGEVVVERSGSPTPVIVDGVDLAARQVVSAPELDAGVTIELGPHVALLLHLHPPLTLKVPRFGLVGDSGAIVRLRQEIELAARLETSVLLRGASGTGKELVARAIHDAGSRRDKPWVTVNMAAIPPSLAAAELFGARKGAYTGADRGKPGYFVTADGGTLFLDEIGDAPPDVQPLLLRALESGEIQPVGSAGTRRVDVRVISATDADLASAVAAGRFREPLLHRLAGWEIRLPALAERRGDVGRLLLHFLKQELGRKLDVPDPSLAPWASASLVGRLARYSWPGNVRQLRNVARRLAILSRDAPGTPVQSAIEPLLTEAPAARSPDAEPAGSREPEATDPSSTTTPTPGRWRPVYRKASEVSEEELLAALRDHKWDLKPTAEALHVSRSVLYQLIESCPHVRIAAQLGAEEIRDALGRCSADVSAAAAALEVSRQGLKLRMKALGLR